MIEINNISKSFISNGQQIDALKNVTLKIEKADIFGIIGLSGAGKSTLIRTINLLEEPTSGDILINGKHVNKMKQRQLRTMRKEIGMIFQHFNLLHTKTIFQNVAMPLILEKREKQFIENRVLELLDFVGLADKKDSYPSELSGGQKQRIGIARALATNPSILLCDEATSALDPQTTDTVLDLLEKINTTYGITIMMIAHDMNIIKKICNRVAVMENGSIIESGDVVDVFRNPQQASTKKFVHTVVQHQLPQALLEKITPLPNSKTIQVSVDHEQSQTIMSTLIKEFTVDLHLIYAAMDEIKESRVGFIVIQIVGEAEDLMAVMAYLKEKEFEVKELL